jgi:hypothetical protein
MADKDLSKSVALKNQCLAHKKTGERCRKAAMRGQRVCRFHGGATKASRNAAQMRLLAAAEPLVVELIRIALDKKTDDDRKLRAIMDALNRIPGLNARHVIDTVALGVDAGPSDPFEQRIRILLDRTPQAPLPPAEPEPEPDDEDVVEAEVVEEPTPIEDGLLIKADRVQRKRPRLLRHDELGGPTDTERPNRSERNTPTDLQR